MYPTLEKYNLCLFNLQKYLLSPLYLYFDFLKFAKQLVKIEWSRKEENNSSEALCCGWRSACKPFPTQ